MSFSGEIKEELSTVTDQSRHCRLAELAAIISGCGQVMIDEDDAYELEIRTENVCLARKYYTLVKKLFGIQAAVLAPLPAWGHSPAVSLCGPVYPAPCGIQRQIPLALWQISPVSSRDGR